MYIMSKFFRNITTIDPLPANRKLQLKSLTWTLFSGKFYNAYRLDFHKKKVWNLLRKSSALKRKFRYAFRVLVAFESFSW